MIFEKGEGRCGVIFVVTAALVLPRGATANVIPRSMPGNPRVWPGAPFPN